MSESTAKPYDPKQAFNSPEAAIRASATAQQHVAEQAKKTPGAKGLRFGVKPAGCTGYKYIVEITDQIDSQDYCFPLTSDLAIIVNPQSMPFVKGTEIDYVAKGLNHQFAYHNPNVQDACGCGESFNIISDDLEQGDDAE